MLSLPPLVTVISYIFPGFKKPDETDKRIIERAENVLRSMSVRKKFSTPCILKYARKHNYDTLSIIRVIDRLRYRRQCLLQASFTKHQNKTRRKKYRTVAKQIQRQLEEIIIQTYIHSGDTELMLEVQRYRFVTQELLGEMVKSRMLLNVFLIVLQVKNLRVEKIQS